MYIAIGVVIKLARVSLLVAAQSEDNQAAFLVAWIRARSRAGLDTVSVSLKYRNNSSGV
jgi:hypothetical protein